MQKVGNLKELKETSLSLPQTVMIELTKDVAILDYEYGLHRDYLKSGGFAVVIESKDDFKAFYDVIGNGCLEHIQLCGDTYINALYLIGDDYAISVFMPISITPQNILEEMRKQNENN